MATSPQPPVASFETFENLKRGDNMALIFQEVLTVIARLRAGRQLVTDADVFRAMQPARWGGLELDPATFFEGTPPSA